MRTYERPQTDEVLATIRECGPVTNQDIQGLIGRSYKSVVQCIVNLRKSNEIHIASYVRISVHGKYTPQYATGNKKDASLPKPLSRSQTSFAYRERHKARLNAKDMVERGTKYNFWNGLL